MSRQMRPNWGQIRDCYENLTYDSETPRSRAQVFRIIDFFSGVTVQTFFEVINESKEENSKNEKRNSRKSMQKGSIRSPISLKKSDNSPGRHQSRFG